MGFYYEVENYFFMCLLKSNFLCIINSKNIFLCYFPNMLLTKKISFFFKAHEMKFLVINHHRVSVKAF